jgi:NAD+ diphosphatase
VVIMLVSGGDRAMLGRQAHWPAGRYSALAGFVEPGESLEEAVAREVREESGVRVTDIEYRSSQPWPFPTSLMLGFRARWEAGEPEVRDGELEDVRWCTRDELTSGAILLPPREAIARRLIDEWLGREAPGATGRLAVS